MWRQCQRQGQCLLLQRCLVLLRRRLKHRSVSAERIACCYCCCYSRGC